jgi:hypothetical protein
MRVTLKKVNSNSLLLGRFYGINQSGMPTMRILMLAFPLAHALTHEHRNSMRETKQRELSANAAAGHTGLYLGFY